MIILISPAKTLDTESKVPELELSEARFQDEASYLNAKLKKLSAKQIAKLQDISPDLADLNHRRNQDWKLPMAGPEARPAGLMFKGDVYQGLELEKMNKSDLKFAQKHLRILSGLYGLLRPLDVILPYRLEMGTPFKVTTAKKNLYAYWGDQITLALKEDMDDELIINLASNEYFKAVKPKLLKARVITPQFLDAKNGEFRMISFFAKKARGLMARYIITNKIQDPEKMKGFDLEGYVYNERLSEGDQWVFTRG